MRNVFLILSLFLVIACGKENRSNENEVPPPSSPTQPERVPTPETPISAEPVKSPSPIMIPTPAPLPIPSPNPTPVPITGLAPLKGYGIQFIGSTLQLSKVMEEMAVLFKEQNIPFSLFSIQLSSDKSTLEYTLISKTTDSMNLIKDSSLAIENASETYINQRGNEETVEFASEKEILLALLQRGRTTTFFDKHCSVESLREHLKLRQNISRWGTRAWFTFPENGAVATNKEFWDSWTVVSGKSPILAIADAFVGKMQYALACTKAVQLIVAQGIVDYFANTKKDAVLLARIEENLGNRPLSNMEPSVSNKKVIEEGTLLTRQFDVPWNNWVPGDWGWIKNDDEESSNTFGGEGSNIIYIGGGYFGSYYGDAGDRTIDEALIRVYNWRDKWKREWWLSEAKLLERIRKDPYSVKGGMLRNVRDIPKNF